MNLRNQAVFRGMLLKDRLTIGTELVWRIDDCFDCRISEDGFWWVNDFGREIGIRIVFKCLLRSRQNQSLCTCGWAIISDARQQNCEQREWLTSLRYLCQSPFHFEIAYADEFELHSKHEPTRGDGIVAFVISAMFKALRLIGTIGTEAAPYVNCD